MRKGLSPTQLTLTLSLTIVNLSPDFCAQEYLFKPFARHAEKSSQLLQMRIGRLLLLLLPLHYHF